MSLYIDERGSKDNPAIVFLHGLGVSSWMWHDQLTALAQDYHCLAIDLPGNGESYQTEWVSFADSAAQVAEVIKKCTLQGQAHVVGLSLGGYVALHVLAHHPEVVDHMIVSGVTSRPFDNPGRWRMMMRVMVPFMRSSLGLSITGRMMQIPPETRSLYKRDGKRLTRLTYDRVYDHLLDKGMPDVLTERERPLLAVAGDAEVQMIKDQLADFSTLIPNGRAAIVPDAHHTWSAEYPELFTQMVRQWIEEHTLPDALNRVDSSTE